MPRSPAELSTERFKSDYVKAWQDTAKLTLKGKSWSGHELNCCFLNTGDQRFANVSAVSGLDFFDDARAVAKVDWDLDGDLDVWISNRTSPRIRFLRNGSSGDCQFLAVRLQGREVNRDAIGARVELYLKGSPPHKRIKTLYAGEAFLSQASKWLHFGLGSSATIDRLVVRWPGGTAETFTGILPNHRYHLIEGRGTARLWERPRQPVTLVATPQSSSPTSMRARAVLSAPIPLPKLRFETFDNQTASLDDYRGQPVLVNLWASWCAPCIQELNEFRHDHKRIDGAGIEIIALSVDGLDDHLTDRQSAVAAIEKGQYPFRVGLASAPLLDKLQIVNDAIFLSHRRMAVPTSLLVDAEGQLAVMYRGPIDLHQLLDDVALLQSPGPKRNQQSLPYLGKWLTPIKPLRVLPIADSLLQRGYRDDGISYFQDHRARIESDHKYYALLYNLGQKFSAEGKHKEAIEYYRQALKRKPDLAPAHYNLAVTYTLTQDQHRAIEHFRKAVELQPSYSLAQFRLGQTLAHLGQLEEATRHLRHALNAQPDYVEAQIELGAVLISSGRTDEAIELLRETIKYAPENVVAQLHLGNALASAGDLRAAASRFRRAVELQPDNAVAHARLAQASTDLGDHRLAVVHFEKALAMNPSHISSQYQLAWLLAASPDEHVRNGERAVELAEHLNRDMGSQDPRVLDLLATAYAEDGDFEAAARTAVQALAKLEPNQETQADAIRKRLELYHQGQPYRDTDKDRPSLEGGPKNN